MVSAAATSIAHWSRKAGPMRPPGRRMARKMAMKWAAAFALPPREGRKTVPSAAATPPEARIVHARATRPIGCHREAGARWRQGAERTEGDGGGPRIRWRRAGVVVRGDRRQGER